MMATVAGQGAKVPNPTYKDYVNFLGNYKKNGDHDQLSVKSADSGVSVRSFEYSKCSNASSSSSSVNSDVPDFAALNTPMPAPVVSYNEFLEQNRSRKFSSVKMNFEEKCRISNNKAAAAPKKPSKNLKSEIYIDIQPPIASRIIEQKSPPQNPKITSKISIFEKPKIAEKPPNLKSPTIKTDPEMDFPPPPPEFISDTQIDCQDDLPPPPPEFCSDFSETPPPPPLPPTIKNTQGRIQATLKTSKTSPEAKFSVNNPAGLGTLDKNDPLVRKLVYGTLRGLYGAYHDRANDFVGTLPKNMVKKSNGVQKIIDEIASNGDLEKLNGRANPKADQEL